MTPVEALVDGVGQQGDGRAGVHPDYCCRSHLSPFPRVVDGCSFCRDCLAWLRCETNDDPLS